MKTEDISKLPPELQRAAELCEKATPGPWAFDPDLEYFFTRHPDLYQKSPTYGQVFKCPETETPLIDDAQFIKESRTALPLALTYCLQMQEERDAFTQASSDKTDWCPCCKQGWGVAKQEVEERKALHHAEATIATLTRERNDWHAKAATEQRQHWEWEQDCGAYKGEFEVAVKERDAAETEVTRLQKMLEEQLLKNRDAINYCLEKDREIAALSHTPEGGGQ